MKPFDVIFDALVKIAEFQKVDLVDRGRILGLGLLDDVTELRRRERQHATPRVVKDCNLASAEKALGDDDASQGILAMIEDTVRYFYLKHSVSDSRKTACIADYVGITLLKAKLRKRAENNVRFALRQKYS